MTFTDAVTLVAARILGEWFVIPIGLATIIGTTAGWATYSRRVWAQTFIYTYWIVSLGILYYKLKTGQPFV